MCWNKRKKEAKKRITRNLFEYLCEDFFKGNKDESNFEYDCIINNAALELMPDVDKFLAQEKDYTTEEVCDICRNVAVKSLLLIALEDDSDDELLKFIQEKYPEELDKLLKKS